MGKVVPDTSKECNGFKTFGSPRIFRVFDECTASVQGHVVMQLVHSLCYNLVGHGLVSMEIFINIILPAALWHWG
jgi:hypothetical protein